MTLFGEIYELYLQYDKFLENLMPTLNKETKVKRLTYLAAFILLPVKLTQKCFCENS